MKTVELAGVRRGVWLIVFAMAFAGLAGVVALRLMASAESRETAAAPIDVALAASAAAPTLSPNVAPLRARPVRRGARPASPPPAPELPAEEPELPQFPDEPVDAPSGIALYPPMGSDPPKRGILVPEDFELPEGYVRHYQASDEGEGLPAILMFHPDYDWIGEDGVAIALPEDRVVPPELAPPGMPIQMLELPASVGELDRAP